jgi:phosphatidylserine/phosphatidylglycerophosphate/cardiolipin synthase-like enzyme
LACAPVERSIEEAQPRGGVGEITNGKRALATADEGSNEVPGPFGFPRQRHSHSARDGCAPAKCANLLGSHEATIEVCFAPEDDCAGFSEHLIAGAEREILVSAYRLTVGSGIVGALIRAKERGVDVRVIADRGAPCGRSSGIEPLAAAGVPVRIDNGARLTHAKTMVIDGAVTLQGSHNWTHAAAENSEDLNRISSPTVAGAYSAHWRQRLAVSVPLDLREDWCRHPAAVARDR